jgi:hypothetical protein
MQNDLVDVHTDGIFPAFFRGGRALGIRRLGCLRSWDEARREQEGKNAASEELFSAA